MAIKNVALDVRVYRRLSGFKRESESFSKAIDRMLNEVEGAHTGADVLRVLSTLKPLTGTEAKSMERIVQQNRAAEDWTPLDLS